MASCAMHKLVASVLTRCVFCFAGVKSGQYEDIDIEASGVDCQC
jgi:nitrogen fixation-related uncharacterized protein